MGNYPTRLERFKTLLNAPPYGQRHCNLLKLAKAGRLANIDSAELARLIHTHWDGNDPLTDREVTDAILKVEEEIPLGGDTPEGTKPTADALRRLNATTPRQPAKPAPDQYQRGFFERMRNAGRAWYADHRTYPNMSSAVYSLSPVQFPLTDWREQAALMTLVLSRDFLGYTFAGDRYEERRLYQAENIAWDFREGKREIPPQIMANQLDGSRHWVKDKEEPAGGHWSAGTAKSILHHRHAVVEFDGYKEKLPDGSEIEHPLPLEEQAAFWLGCVVNHIFSLRTLTFSGSKSIHGIIRMKELQDLTSEELARYATRGNCEPAKLEAAELWRLQWQDLEQVLCSADNRLYRLDPSCKDPTRLTRLAGHLRADKRKRQRLLWLAPPDPRDY